jgi:HAD superfamily hydrolase (TIGR01509 family)
MDSKFAFLFDMDGVIVDSNPAHKIALRQFCRKYGRDLSEEQLKEKIYGRTNKDWLPAVFGEITEEQLRRYADEKESLFRDIYKSSIQPVPGLMPFLQKLQAAGIPTAIATSAPRANVDFTLKHTGTGEFFKTILDESFVSRGKPDPEIYLKAAAAIGFAPANCIVLEDSLSGVKSGKAAGCMVLAITTTHSAEELYEADAITADFIGLEPTELISRLFS